MRLRSVIILALCLCVVAYAPARPLPVQVRSMSVGQPVDWSPLTHAVTAREAWFTALPPAAATPPARRRLGAARYGTGACGGNLPPCSVMWCESHGSLTAQNPHSTASGKWQILDSTWGGYGGYARAKDAPESVQDERAAQIYAGGAGRSQWVC